MDQGSTRRRSAVHNFAPTVTKLSVMWEGQALPHDTKFSNSGCAIVGRRVIFIWSLIHGSSWSGLIKVGPGVRCVKWQKWKYLYKISTISSWTLVKLTFTSWPCRCHSCSNVRNNYVISRCTTGYSPVENGVFVGTNHTEMYTRSNGGCHARLYCHQNGTTPHWLQRIRSSCYITEKVNGHWKTVWWD